MKNNITELVFILDRSGSMAGLEKDTIGGFNSMIEKQRKLDGKCYVSTVLFDNTSVVIHDRVELEKVRKMTEDDYTVGGCTALLDAVGSAVKHISTIHRYIRKEDLPQHTMFVITTDGCENASHNYTAREIKKLIETKREKDGWEFIFIGANIDAAETAENIGIARDRAVNYHADATGTQVAYEAVEKAVRNVRASRPLAADWSKELAADYKKRKR